MMFSKITFLGLFSIIAIVSSSCSTSDHFPIDKTIVDIGDSLTYGHGGDGVTMSSVTDSLLPPDWVVDNMGVGGENTLEIGARYGAIPGYITDSISLPGDGSNTAISSGLLSTYNDMPLKLMLQGDAGINPCTVNNIKCYISKRADDYLIRRLDTITDDVMIAPGAILKTALSKKTYGVATIFIGQNGGYDSAQDFLNQIDLFVKHKGDSNFIIITSHRNGHKETVAPIIEKYKEKVIDLKTYMVTQALNDAISLGLLPDDGSYPTAQDIEAINNNYAPPSLLIDIVHMNAIGYELLGRLRYNKGKELGYW